MILFSSRQSFRENTEKDWENIWGPNIYFGHGTSDSAGVAILIKRNSNIKVINHIEINCGRAQLLEIEHDTVKIALVIVYCPNNDDLDFLKKVFHETLGRARDDMIIYGGDWNAVMDDDLDRLGGSVKHSSQKSQKFLNNIINDFGLSDIYRLSKDDSRIYTHFNKKSHTASRLDFFLIDDNLVNLPVCAPEVSHGFLSDHSYISLFMKGSPIERERGYWKLNNSHLENENFIKEVKNIIRETESTPFDSYKGLWDVIKFKIKDFDSVLKLRRIGVRRRLSRRRLNALKRWLTLWTVKNRVIA